MRALVIWWRWPHLPLIDALDLRECGLHRSRIRELRAEVIRLARELYYVRGLFVCYL